MSLHIEGYEIFSSQIKVTKEVLEEFRRQSKLNWGIIFNHNFRDDANGSEKNDRKRLQTDVRINRKLSPFMRELNSWLKELYTELSIQDWVIIRSLPGCRIQAAHLDYVPDENLAKAPDLLMPLNVLVGLQDNTPIMIWPNSIRLAYLDPDVMGEPIEGVSVKINKGDILIFRGDLVHAGHSFEEENIRLHCFLDSPVVKRDPNVTWIVHDEGSQQLKDRILL